MDGLGQHTDQRACHSQCNDNRSNQKDDHYNIGSGPGSLCVLIEHLDLLIKLITQRDHSFYDVFIGNRILVRVNFICVFIALRRKLFALDKQALPNFRDRVHHCLDICNLVLVLGFQCRKLGQCVIKNLAGSKQLLLNLVQLRFSHDDGCFQRVRLHLTHGAAGRPKLRYRRNGGMRILIRNRGQPSELTHGHHTQHNGHGNHNCKANKNFSTDFSVPHFYTLLFVI